MKKIISSKREPKLYSLVRYGHGSNWALVRNYLASLHQLDNAEQKTLEVMWKHPKTGVTAFHVTCCWSPPIDVVRDFISFFPFTTFAQSNNGSTPLHLACGNAASAEMVSLLLSPCDSLSGCFNENKQGQCCTLITCRDKGWTPLHYAIVADASFDTLRVILEYNPKVAFVKDKEGRTALDILCHSYHSALVAILDRMPDSIYNECSDFLQGIGNDFRNMELSEKSIVKDFFSRASLLIRALSSHKASKTNDLKSNDLANGLAHTIAGLESNFPPLALKFILKLIAHQLKEKDENGNLPLHIACCNAIPGTSPILKMILAAYPEATRVRNFAGHLPLHLRLRNSSEVQNNEVLFMLVQANPPSLESLNLNSFYCPTLFSLFGKGRMHKQFPVSLNVIFHLLKENPAIVKVM